MRVLFEPAFQHLESSPIKMTMLVLFETSRKRVAGNAKIVPSHRRLCLSARCSLEWVNMRHHTMEKRVARAKRVKHREALEHHLWIE